MSSTRLQTRIDPIIKEKAEKIMKKNGYTPSRFINILYTYISETEHIPIKIEMEEVPVKLTELKHSELTPKLEQKIQKVKKMKKSDLINI